MTILLLWPCPNKIPVPSSHNFDWIAKIVVSVTCIHSYDLQEDLEDFVTEAESRDAMVVTL